MKTIFISYRRSDSLEETKCLERQLIEWLGDELVFRDEEAMPPGHDFRKVIRDALGESLAVLVILGEHWLDAKDESGQRRLDLEDDTVRVEVELALSSGVPVVPVLLPGAKLPREDDLPESIKSLRYRHAIAFDPHAKDVSDLTPLLDALSNYIFVDGDVPWPRAADHYMPKGAWFKKRPNGWDIGARYEIQPISVLAWPLILLAITLSLYMPVPIAGTVVFALKFLVTFIDPVHNRVEQMDIAFFFIFLGLSLFTLLLPWLPFVGRSYRAWLSNRFGRTRISLRGEFLRISDGLPIVGRLPAAKLDSLSLGIGQDCFKLVVNRGGPLDIPECYEFGRHLSIMKKRFILRAWAKLRPKTDPTKSHTSAHGQFGHHKAIRDG
jgi:hypothetical protein